jgi:hypothetical protein
MSRQFMILVALRGVKLLPSVISLILCGHLFGLGLQMDSWVFSFGVISAVSMMLWGPVNEITRSRFLSHVALFGFNVAAETATKLLRFTLIGCGLISFVMWVYAPRILGLLYASELSHADALVLQLFYLLIPSLALGQLNSLGVAYLNCCDVIYVPEVIAIGASTLSLISIFFLAPTFGIYAMAVGHYIYVFISVFFVLFLLHRRRFFRGSWFPLANRPMLDYLVFAAPLYLSYLAGAFNGLVEKTLASGMEIGVLTSINYASQIKSTLAAVLTSVIFSLTVPSLTRQASKSFRSPEFLTAWREVQRNVMVFLFAVIPPIWVGSPLIANIIFVSSRIDENKINLVVMLIRYYLLAVVPVALYLVHGAALLAQQKGRSYAIFGIISQAVSAAFAIVLLPIFGPQVFPLGLLFAHILVAIAMACKIGPTGELWAELVGWLFLIAIAVIFMSRLSSFVSFPVSSASVMILILFLIHAAIVGVSFLVISYARKITR